MSFIIPRFAIVASIAATALVQPYSALATEPVSTWLTEDGRARVRTEHCGPQDKQICGYIVWYQKQDDEKGRPHLDVENPDARKRARAILGHQMLLGLRAEGDGRFAGKIYNADNGRKYDVTIWRDTAGELSVQGCMLTVLCGNQTWKKVTDVVADQLIGPTDGPGGPRSDPEWVPRSPQPSSMALRP